MAISDAGAPIVQKTLAFTPSASANYMTLQDESSPSLAVISSIILLANAGSTLSLLDLDMTYANLNEGSGVSAPVFSL